MPDTIAIFLIETLYAPGKFSAVLHLLTNNRCHKRPSIIKMLVTITAMPAACCREIVSPSNTVPKNTALTGVTNVTIATFVAPDFRKISKNNI